MINDLSWSIFFLTLSQANKRQMPNAFSSPSLTLLSPHNLNKKWSMVNGQWSMKRPACNERTARAARGHLKRQSIFFLTLSQANKRQMPNAKCQMRSHLHSHSFYRPTTQTKNGQWSMVNEKTACNERPARKMRGHLKANPGTVCAKNKKPLKGHTCKYCQYYVYIAPSGLAACRTWESFQVERPV